MKKIKEFIPLGKINLDEREYNEVIKTLKSGWITTGIKSKNFEKNFAKFIHLSINKSTLGLNSCTAALHLALVGEGIGQGDEVILPVMTFAATANVVEHVKAKPIFIDIREDTFNINEEQIEKAITKRTKAIIVVHFAGQACEMQKILEICKKYNICLIEDCAHALDSYYNKKHLGTFGNYGTFSFHPLKNITTGEGGMIVTFKNKMKLLRALSLHGMSKDAWKRYDKKGKAGYDIIAPGFKYNMTDIQASLGIHQLKKLRSFNKKRRKLFERYYQNLKQIPQIILPEIKIPLKYHGVHIFTIVVKFEKLKIDRDDFINILKKNNIGTGIHFKSLNLHSFYKNKYKLKKRKFKVGTYVGERIVSLPLYPDLTLEQVDKISEVISMIIRKYKK